MTGKAAPSWALGYFFLLSLVLWKQESYINCVSAFVPVVRTHNRPLPPDTWRKTSLQENRWDRQIDENSRRKAKGGAGETAAGAVLGGLLFGPFGALFGASIGSNIGAKNAMDRARQEEMGRLGISSDMLEAANDIGLTLQESIEGLKASQNSLATQQTFAKRLDREAMELYEKAKAALAESKEETARELLLKRTQVQDKLKQALTFCAEEKKRLERMEDNVEKLEQRAMEIDSLLRRSVGAKAVQKSEDYGLALSNEDPLLQKFRDLGID